MARSPLRRHHQTAPIKEAGNSHLTPNKRNRLNLIIVIFISSCCFLFSSHYSIAVAFVASAVTAGCAKRLLFDSGGFRFFLSSSFINPRTNIGRQQNLFLMKQVHERLKMTLSTVCLYRGEVNNISFSSRSCNTHAHAPSGTNTGTSVRAHHTRGTGVLEFASHGVCVCVCVRKISHKLS